MPFTLLSNSLAISGVGALFIAWANALPNPSLAFSWKLSKPIIPSFNLSTRLSKPLDASSTSLSV